MSAPLPGQPPIRSFFGGARAAAAKKSRAGAGARGGDNNDVCIIDDGDCARGGAFAHPSAQAQPDVFLISDDSNLSVAAAASGTADPPGEAATADLDADAAHGSARPGRGLEEAPEEKSQVHMQLQADMSKAEASSDPR